jgi:feruloyl esterase
MTVNTTADLCRVVVSVATTSTSRVLVEAWLPDEWNSRLLASGGGGIGGCVDYNSLPCGVSLGRSFQRDRHGYDLSYICILFPVR